MKVKKLLPILFCGLSFSLCSCSNNLDNVNIPDNAVEFNGHKYVYYLDTVDWYSAKEKCESVKGHLVTITSDEENQFLVNNFPDELISFFWIGASDEEQEGKWYWVTGEKFEYDNWSTGNPNNDSDNEHFAGIMKYEENFDYLETPIGTWNDFSVKTRYRSGYICEWESSKVLNFSLNLEINGIVFSFSPLSMSIIGGINLYAIGVTIKSIWKFIKSKIM